MLLIPRRFHRIWLGGRPMPREYIEFGESWLAHHPGWTMHTWTDAHVRGLTNSEAFRRSAAHSGKANVLRYEILLAYGGIYIDTDFECLRNMERLLSNSACFLAEQSPGFANNAIIGAVAGHPFLRDLVANLSRRLPTFGRQQSIKQSGPYYLNEILRNRLDVTIFPAELFYPYQWHERWRRHEYFPNAYGAHHWSLSWRKATRSKPCAGQPKLSILLVNITADLQRLQWALEGLCAQTAAGTFEVIMLDQSKSSQVKALAHTYADRLCIRYTAATHLQRGLLSEDVKRYAKLCRAGRVLLLDSHCIPGPRVVEEHAQHGRGGVVAFSSQQLYPGQKLFPFAPPLDYDALKIHSVPDPRYQAQQAQTRRTSWQDVPESCISVPVSALTRLPLPPTVGLYEGGRWLARELSLRGHGLVSLPMKASVTRMIQ